MSLPLPPVLCHTQDLDEQYTADQMRACREQALEEAVKVCRLLADCEENTTDYRNGAAWCAEKIRSLK